MGTLLAGLLLLPWPARAQKTVGLPEALPPASSALGAGAAAVQVQLDLPFKQEALSPLAPTPGLVAPETGPVIETAAPQADAALPALREIAAEEGPFKATAAEKRDSYYDRAKKSSDGRESVTVVETKTATLRSAGTLKPHKLHRLKPDNKINLSEKDPGATPGFKKGSKELGRRLLAKEQEKLYKLQDALFAESKRSVLVVIQAMDTAGKDGIVKHVFGGLNPAWIQHTAYKKPSAEEFAHDFLWRIHKHVPAKGLIGIFNRSQYEDILVPSVYGLLPKKEIDSRYGQINDFEKHLAANGVTVVKIFLHISKDEQKERLQARLDDPEKLWKFMPEDLKTREHWDDFMAAYQKILRRTSTDAAPWYLIPANRKWYARYAVARILRETLEEMDPQYPKPVVDPKTIRIPD